MNDSRTKERLNRAWPKRFSFSLATMFPPELSDRIIDLLDGPRSWRAASLVSRSWRNRSQFKIFQDPLREWLVYTDHTLRVSLNSNDARARTLLLHLYAHPRLQPYVETLRLRSTCPGVTGWMRRPFLMRELLVHFAYICRRVRYLNISRGVLDALTAHEYKALVASRWLRRIKELTLIHDLTQYTAQPLFTAQQLFDTLSLFTGLESLSYPHSEAIVEEGAVVTPWRSKTERLVWVSQLKLLDYIETSKRLWYLLVRGTAQADLSPLQSFVLRHSRTLQVLDVYIKARHSASKCRNVGGGNMSG